MAVMCSEGTMSRPLRVMSTKGQEGDAEISNRPNAGPPAFTICEGWKNRL